MADKLERIYTVPLGDAYNAVRKKRAGRAVKILRKFVGRHMKAEEENVSLSNALNSYIWKDSIQKPPRKVKVRLIKEDGQVKAYLADEKIEKPEPKKEEKKKEEPKKEEKKPTEVEEREKEAKKELTVKSEAAMAKKETDKAIKSEEAKIDEANKRKFTHGKETQ